MGVRVRVGVRMRVLGLLQGQQVRGVVATRLDVAGAVRRRAVEVHLIRVRVRGRVRVRFGVRVRVRVKVRLKVGVRVGVGVRVRRGQSPP